MNDMRYMTLKSQLLKNPTNAQLKKEFKAHVDLLHRRTHKTPSCLYCGLKEFMVPGRVESTWTDPELDKKPEKNYNIDGFRCDICGFLVFKATEEITSRSAGFTPSP